MVVRELVTLLGFKVEDGELKKFIGLVDNAKANIDTFISSLQIKPSVDDGSVKQFGETIDAVQAKAESLGSQTAIAPTVDDAQIKGLENTIDDVTARSQALGVETIKPTTDDSAVRGLGDEVDKTKAKTDALGSTKVKPEADGGPVRGLGDEVDKTKGKVESLASAILKANLIMKAASMAMGAAIGFVRDAVIGTAAETERYRVTLGTMIGDQEKANKIIHDLDYGEGMFAGSKISDFYGTANAIGGLQNMVTFGMEAEKAGDILTRIGDIAQGNTEAFVSMSNNMGQVFAKGKADAADLKQFVMQGFDVVGEVAKQSGKSRAEIEKSGVTYEQTAAALRSLTSEGGKYHGMLAKQMNTLGGVLKQFASLKAATAEAIGTGISDQLKELLKYILEIGRAGQDSFVNVFVKAIKEVIHWIWQIIIMWKVLGYRIADMGDALAPVKNIIRSFSTMLGNAFAGIGKFVISVAKTVLTAFDTIDGLVGPVIENIGHLLREIFSFLASAVEGAIPILMMLGPPFDAIGWVLGVILKGLGGLIKFFEPLAPLIGFIAAAIGFIAAAIGIWTAAQWALNVAVSANPIGLIIAAVVAGVALIVGLVMVVIENWDKVAAFFVWLGHVIADAFMWVVNKIVGFFTWVIDKIKMIWNGIVDFFKKWGEVILQVLAVIIFGIPGLMAVAVRQIIKHWDVIGPKVKAIWGKIKAFFVALGKQIANIFLALVNKIKQAFQWVVDRAIAIWDTLKDWFGVLVEGIKGIWLSITSFFSGLWEGIVSAAINAWNAFKDWIAAFVEAVKLVWSAITGFFSDLWGGIVNTAMAVWDTLKSWFSGLVEGIKTIWNGITGFFTGLWEAIMQGPGETIEYIRNAFFDLFNSIQERLFGFISKIREGWETVKGFFGGIADGVVNFFTGGDSGDSGGQLQPAYAGSASQAAMAGAVGQTSNYAYNTMGSNSTVNAQTSINVNVPPGTPQEQREAIARQVDAQFEAKLAGSINSSRANIPSPEVRRH
jgi:phage-related protein